MKMMLVGGEAAKGYAKHIEGHFSVAVNVMSGVTLEDIESAVVLGNVFNRVLVLEQSWRLGEGEKEEAKTRRAINRMAAQARERGGNEQYVFMTHSEKTARICIEETYDICGRVAVVKCTGRVTSVMLYDLLASDIAVIKPSLVYSPGITKVEMSYSVDIDFSKLEGKGEIDNGGGKAPKVLKKVRGAKVRRAEGGNPWYSKEGNMQQRQVNNYQQNAGMQGNVQGVYGQNQGSSYGGQVVQSSSNGFEDTAPIVGSSDVELKDIFKNKTMTTNIVQPKARIPVGVGQGISRDLKGYLSSKIQDRYVLTFLGPGGSGSTFMGLNCAARLHSAGYRVMYIDGDTVGRSAQYLTSLGLSGTDEVLKAESEERVLKQGFSMYSASQFKEVEGASWSIPEELLAKYTIVVADIPMAYINPATDIVKMSDSIVVTVDSSNWGIGKATHGLFQTPADLAPVIKAKGKLLYNRSDKLSAGLYKVQVTNDKEIKGRIESMFGYRSRAFTELPMASIIGSYTGAEEYWFSNRLFSDSPEGAALFDNIVSKII